MSSALSACSLAGGATPVGAESGATLSCFSPGLGFTLGDWLVNDDGSADPLTAGSSVWGGPGVSAGVAGLGEAVFWGRSFSLFFSSVRKKALSVVRNALLGLHKSPETGVWVQTGQLSGREPWPVEVEG